MKKAVSRDEVAQGLAEYALVIVLVALIAVIGVSMFGENVSNVYAVIINTLQASPPPDPEEAPSTFTQTACEDEVSSLSNWKITTKGKKDWNCDGDSLCVENNKANQNFVYSKCSKTKKKVPADYEVEITNASLSSGDGFNLLFRVNKYTAKPSGYAFTYDANTNAFVLVKLVKGKQTPIASAPAAGFAQYNIPHNYKVQVQGDVIKAYVDNSLVLTAQDATYSAGGAGIHVAGQDGSACFDNLTIRISEE